MPVGGLADDLYLRVFLEDASPQEPHAFEVVDDENAAGYLGTIATSTPWLNPQFWVNEIASPKDVAARLGLPIPNTSYHFGILRSLGLIKVVRQVPRRGAMEHYYEAVSRALTVRQVIDWILAADHTKPRGWNAKLAEFDSEGVAAVRASIERLAKDVERAEQQTKRRTAKAANHTTTRHAVGAFSTRTPDA